MPSDLILLGHGSGGRLSHELLDGLIAPALSGIGARDRDDAAVLTAAGGRLAFTTDSYVVDPIFFPGGDIGSLAIHGTVNDLAMAGADPLFISAGLIIEEGLPVVDLKAVLASMRKAADDAGVRIVTGDTKVVPRGKADRLFVNTSGIGVVAEGVELSGRGARPGDRILLSGTMGDHGLAVLTCRAGLALDSPVISDSAPLTGLVRPLLHELGAKLHVLRDPTRGGVATTLKEIALQSRVDLLLQEDRLPVNPAVASSCALLGIDPLYVANEGKLLAFVAADVADRALDLLRGHVLGRRAAIIGEVTATGNGRVSLATAIGGRRSVEMLSGEQLPRIC